MDTYFQFKRMVKVFLVAFFMVFIFSGSVHSVVSSSNWNIAKVLSRAESRLTGVGVSPDSQYIAYMEDDGRVYIHRVGGDWPLIKIFYEPDVHLGGDVEFSHDGRWLVYGFLRDERNAVLQAVKVDGWKEEIRKEHGSGSGRSAGTLSDLVFSEDDRWLVSGTNSNHCFVWDVEDKFNLAHVFHPSRFAQNPAQISISGDGKYLLITASQSSPEVYEVGTWQRVHTLKNITRSGAPAVGKDNVMFFADRSGNWWVYKLEDDEARLLTERQANNRVIRSNFSPSGDLLALADVDGKLEIINTRTWQPVKTFNESGGVITGISFSSDDKYIAYSSQDNNVYVHNVPSEIYKSPAIEYMTLLDTDTLNISDIVLDINEEESTLKVKYGDKSEFTVKYGEGSYLLINDKPGQGLKIKLKFK